jgi:hypothetical protein
LDKEVQGCFGLDVNKIARFTIFDTAAAARMLSILFDSMLQTTCTTNLCIGYGIGLKKNVHNLYELNSEMEAYVKTRRVDTEGGDFTEGSVAIRKLRALNNFLSSSNHWSVFPASKKFNRFSNCRGW